LVPLVTIVPQTTERSLCGKTSMDDIKGSR
jgi:hypothetical protein